jgi:hypothetical protein
MTKYLPDLTGRCFGRLTVTGAAGKDEHGRTLWACVCDCGGVATSIRRYSSMNGNTRSCGCLRRETQSKNGAASKGRLPRHGLARRGTTSSEWHAWQGMKQRCLNPNDTVFKYYGGRGIRVCDRWRDSFDAFLADMGRKPSPELTLDRFDVNGDYEPGNCRWTSWQVQRANQRRSA